MPSISFTSLNVVKHYSNVITTWQRSAVEVTALINNLHSEIEGVQEKESVTGVRGRQKSPSLRITVWHHEASLVMPDSDPWDGFFYLPSHQ